ncbi:MAG: hypothetical protein HY903_03935 [Deltaproteobacteria bacterium]|nr:hypothetical protein [Deltaproteobacteria bacterium]
MNATSIQMNLLSVAILVVVLAACGTAPSDEKTVEAEPSAPGIAPLSVVRGAVTSKVRLTIAGTVIDTSGAVVEIDGHLAIVEAVELGMMAVAAGTPGVNGLVAESVRVAHTVRGRVTGHGVDVVYVGNHPVQLSRATVVSAGLGDLSVVPVGTPVRVFGEPDDSGWVRASRIDDTPAPEDEAEFELEIKGYVAGLSIEPAAAFDLLMTIDGAPFYHVTLAEGATLPAGIAEGSFVEIKARTAPEGESLVASRIELEDEHIGREDEHEREDEHFAELEVEGLVTSGDASAFVVAGQSVTTDAMTVFVGGLATEILPGVKVEAKGSLSADGILVARRVSLREFLRLQGPVTALAAIGAHEGSFELLGSTILVDAMTELRGESGSTLDLAALGGAVKIRGRLAQNGSDILATRVESVDDSRIFVESTVSAKDEVAGTLTMLGLTVATGSARVSAVEANQSGTGDGTATPARLADIEINKTLVKARGAGPESLVGEVLTAEEIELQTSL